MWQSNMLSPRNLQKGNYNEQYYQKTKHVMQWLRIYCSDNIFSDNILLFLAFVLRVDVLQPHEYSQYIDFRDTEKQSTITADKN